MKKYIVSEEQIETLFKAFDQFPVQKYIHATIQQGLETLKKEECDCNKDPKKK